MLSQRDLDSDWNVINVMEKGQQKPVRAVGGIDVLLSDALGVMAEDG